MLLIRKPDVHDIDPQLVRRAKRKADRGIYTGQPTRANQLLIHDCTHLEPRTGTVLIYSRDADAHLSGWWKNPDYARCLHLSLSYRDPPTSIPRPHDHALSELWCRAFFGDDTVLLWCEPPFSSTGQVREVWHYRLFVERDWRTAIKPRGEVYSRRNTPAGWLSWSDVQEQRRKLGEIEPKR